MAKKHKSYPGEPTLDMGFDEMDAVSQQETGPVTVLGMTFSNDEERRAYFREQLRAKLPELRNIEGFPIGSDDDIVNLSDPPYYTACPNPWLNDFIAEWEQEKLQLEAEGKRHPNVVVNEPYAADVSEGKSNPIYNAHSYHTKVPHPAIMRYLLQYTQPGDIVLDAFAGTGMTGVAATMCDGHEADTKGKLDSETKFSHNICWGKRHAILSDLSPVASLISAVYNTPLTSKNIFSSIREKLAQVESELGWLYNTTNVKGREVPFSYIVYSDIFICPKCGGKINFYEAAVNPNDGSVSDEFRCPNCGSVNSKKTVDKSWVSSYDSILHEVTSTQEKVPVLVAYSEGRKTIKKPLNDFDVSLIEKAKTISSSFNSVILRMTEGSEARRNDRQGITHVHQFYFPRTLIVLERLLSLCDAKELKFLVNSQLVNISKLNRYRPSVSFPYNPLSGTLYISSQISEANVFHALKNKLSKLEKLIPTLDPDNVMSVASATSLTIPEDSIDYIFTDPPFGANFSYSELNFLQEAWLKVITDNRTEAIVNNSLGKSLFDYQSLMTDSFREYFRVLKPGKWMTVEFSNTSAAVWNSIQTSLQNVGFVVANVSALDKQQGSFKAVTTTTAVKQDLIISCFKPSEQLLYKFKSEAPETNVWDFIDELLSRLPVHLEHGNKTTAVVERSPKILYDRLISFYVQHGFPVPLNAQEFQAGLRERYAERDGMYFTPSQAAKYDELRKRTDGFQASLFFVDSEQGGIAWLNNELSTPQTYQDLQPKWMQAINGVRKGDILPELMQILEENFIKESDGKWRKPNLQDDVDLAALRHKALMREFKVYVEVAQKPRGKIKEARVEALRAGFKQCYQDKDFATIVAVGDRIPQNLLTEDEQLLQFYEIASSRV